MITDRRFAILIGINDYQVKPLDFCIDDASAVDDILVDKCLFDRDDVYCNITN
jgi:hypothetical protein